eukprot:6507282-Prymnesium_polylepis.1
MKSGSDQAADAKPLYQFEAENQLGPPIVLRVALAEKLSALPRVWASDPSDAPMDHQLSPRSQSLYGLMLSTTKKK